VYKTILAITILIGCLFFSANTFAAKRATDDGADSVIMEGIGFYMQGVYGQSGVYNPSTLNDIPESTPHEQKNGYGFMANIGIDVRGTALEFTHSNLGKIINRYKGYYQLQEAITFNAYGLRTTWAWFSLRAGMARVKVYKSFQADSTATTTVLFTPDTKKEMVSGAYWGLGLKFNLGESTALVIESMALMYKDTEQRYQIGTNNNTLEKKTRFIQYGGLGLRVFF
jgi:hypothetical protein